MKWIKKFDKQEWELEGEIVVASVCQTAWGSWRAWWPTGNAEYRADAKVEDILAEVQDKCVVALKDVLAELKRPLPVEEETAPYEVIPNSQGKAGYHDGWLIVKEDRQSPHSAIDTLKLDDGREAHIHPFIRPDSVLAEALGVSRDSYVAGVRWFQAGY